MEITMGPIDKPRTTYYKTENSDLVCTYLVKNLETYKLEVLESNVKRYTKSLLLDWGFSNTKVGKFYPVGYTRVGLDNLIKLISSRLDNDLPYYKNNPLFVPLQNMCLHYLSTKCKLYLKIPGPSHITFAKLPRYLKKINRELVNSNLGIQLKPVVLTSIPPEYRGLPYSHIFLSVEIVIGIYKPIVEGTNREVPLLVNQRLRDLNLGSVGDYNYYLLTPFDYNKIFNFLPQIEKVLTNLYRITMGNSLPRFPDLGGQ